MTTAGSAVHAKSAAPAGPARTRSPRYERLKLVAEIVYDEMVRDRLFTQAAALTYKTLFSLLPVLVLSLMVLSKISSGDGNGTLDMAVKTAIYQQLSFDKLTITNGDGQAVSLADFANEIIAKARGSVNNPATGWVAFGVLLYGAVSLMIVIETTFNQMFGATKGRTWLRRLMLYWCVLTLGPLGVGASIALGRSAYTTATSIANVGWVLTAINTATGFALSWLLILLLYKVVPETQVKWRQAAVGSFLAALVWEIGKWGFGLYVENAVKRSWYGSLALLPLFMFWIYISWSVVLIGLELTYVQQYWRILKRRFLFSRAAVAGGFGHSIMFSDVRWVVALGALVARHFREGKATGAEEAAETLLLPNDVTGLMLNALEKSGILVCVESRDRQYTLARPAESISVQDLLTPIRAMTQAPTELIKERGSEASLSPGLRDFENLEIDWAKKKTLADLAGD